MSMPGGTGGTAGSLQVNIGISTTGAGAAQQQMKAVTTAAKSMGGSIASSAVPIRTMGDAMRQSASLIKYSVIGSFVNAGQEAIKMSRAFELAFSRIQGLVGESAAQIDMYKEAVLGLAGQTTKTPIELADALYFITSAGIKGQEALEVLEQSARSAAAGLGETKTVADALTSILNAYGEETYSAAYANDILVATVREGKAEAEDFAPALGKVLPVAAAFGATFEDVSAGVAALTRNGASAGTSAIYLRQVLSQLLKPSKQASDQMLAVGTSAEELRRRIQEDGLLNALEFLNARLGGTETEVAAAGLTKVFGNVRALTAVFSLLGPNLEANREIFEELNAATGDANVAFDTYAETADAKFNKSLAATQTALIGLGDAIMPVATTFVQIGTFVANASASVLKFLNSVPGLSTLTKVVFGASAAFFILSRGVLFAFTRFTAIFRLFAQGQVVLKGLAMGIKTQTTQTAGLTRITSLLGMKQAERIVLEHTINQAIGKNGISEKRLYEAVARGTSNRVLANIAAAKAASTNSQVTITNNAMAVSAIKAGLGIQVLAYRLITLVPAALGVFSLVFSLYSLFKTFFSKKDDMSGMEERKKSLSEVNELLGETISLTKTGLSVTVDIDTDETTKSITKKLEEELPENILNAVNNARKYLAENLQGRASIGAAIISSLDFKTEKQKNDTIIALSQLLNISTEDLIDSIEPERIGRDASGVVASTILTAFASVDNDVATAISKDGYSSAKEALRKTVAELAKVDDTATQSLRNDLSEIFETIGEGISVNVQGGDFGAYIASLEGLSSQLKLAGATAEQQQLAFNGFNQSIFQSIKGTNDLKQDARGLASEIFGAEENTGALTSILKDFAGSEKSALDLIKQVNKAFEENPDVVGVARLETQLMIDVVSEFTEANRENKESLDEQADGIYDVAEQFKEGLAESIRTIKEEYDAATKAIENFESGQEAVLGLARDFDDAQQNARDAQRGLNDALKESGGAVDTSVLGDKARSAIKDYQEEILSLANAFAVQPGLSEKEVESGVSQIIATGATRILESVKDAGGNIEEAREYLKSINFDISQPDTLANLTQTFFGEGKVDTSKLGDIAKIPEDTLRGIGQAIPSIGAQAAQAAQPGTTAFNDAIRAQFLAFWGIKSPSAVAAQEIGIPIGEGVIIGIGEGLSMAVLRMIASGFKKRVVSAFSGIKVEVGNQLGEKVVSQITDAGKVAEDATAKALAAITDVGNQTSATGGGGDTRGEAFRRGKQFGRFFKKGITAELAKSFLEKKDDIETPILDLIDRVIGDSADALSTIGDYIGAQIDFQEALSENLKLANEQLSLQSALNKARRESERSTRRFGAQGGTEITDYEQAQIEELQKTFEKVSRDYSLRRASIADVIDAEEALNEARIAAGEVSDKVIDSRNEVIDAETKLKTAGLESAKAIYDVVEAQKDLVESAINFKLNGAQAASVFQRFADQAFPGLEYRVSMATGTIYKAGIALTDDNGLFQQSLRGLGQKIFDALAKGIEEARAKSTVPEFFQPAAEPKAPSTPAPTQTGLAGQVAFGNQSGLGYSTTPLPVLTAEQTAVIAGAVAEIVVPRKNVPNVIGYGDLVRGIIDNVRGYAAGGLVTRPQLAVVGEAGPELIVPLGGLGVTTALQNLVPANPAGAQTSNSGDKVFNIIVNNPVPETASDSISRRMRSLASSGLFG